MKLKDLDMLYLIPEFMKEDEAVKALSESVTNLLKDPDEKIKNLRTWDRIQNLSEPECDELSWEMNVDWYDSEGMTLQEKRDTLEVATEIKKKRGTKWAVEKLISIYFGEGYVYEYDEKPYTFSVLTTNKDISPDVFEKFIKSAKIAKNTRSYMEGIFYFWRQNPKINTSIKTDLKKYNFRLCGTYPRAPTIGISIREYTEIAIESNIKIYDYPKTEICGTYPQKQNIGMIIKKELETSSSIKLKTFNYVPCGTRRCGE